MVYGRQNGDDGDIEPKRVTLLPPQRVIKSTPQQKERLLDQFGYRGDFSEPPKKARFNNPMAKTEDQVMLKNTIWQEAVDDNGRVYWYHTKTRSTTWHNPNRPSVDRTMNDEDLMLDHNPIDSNNSDEFGLDRCRSTSTLSDSEYQFPERHRESVQVSSVKGALVQRTRISSPPASDQQQPSVEVADEEFARDKRPMRSSSPSAPQDGWIECKEVVSGRTFFYHNITKEIVFDKLPLKSVSRTPSLTNFDSSIAPFPSYVQRGSIAVSQRLSVISSGDLSISRYHTQSLSSLKLSEASSTPAVPSLVPDEASQLHCLPIVADLLDASSLPWNFNNPVAHYYRFSCKLGCTLFNDIPPAQAILYPRYFSTVPIPAQKHFVCTVKIPDSHVNNGISHTKIHCSATDSANDMVWKALKKCDGKQFEPEKCILKALGTEEYVYGSANVLDFEYIRTCITNHTEIRLSLLYIEDVQNQVQLISDELENDTDSPLYPDDIPEAPIFSEEDFQEACASELVSIERLRVLPLNQMTTPLTFHAFDLENIQICPRFEASIYAVCVEIRLMFGAATLSSTTLRTRFRRPREGLLFLQDITMGSVDICSIPLGAVLLFSAYGVRLEQKEVLLAYVKQPVIEYNNCLVSGNKSLPMWALANDDKEMDDLAFARSTCLPNFSSLDAPTLNIKFAQYMVPIMAAFPSLNASRSDSQTQSVVSSASLNIPSKMRTRLEQIVARDALTELDNEEKGVLWAARYNYVQDPSVLPKILRCVDWFVPHQRNEAYVLLHIWAKPSQPLHALALLDVQYADHCVREYAVEILDELSDSDLQQVLLQLVQVLKFEIYHDSPISRFLLRRSVRNPYQIGHFFFWHMKAEVHRADFCERYALLLENYIVHFKKHARELQEQNIMIKEFQKIAEEVAYQKNKEFMPDGDCKAMLKRRLTLLNANFPSRWQIPLNPKWQVRALDPASCKYMSSKKVPLWLNFVNCDLDAFNIKVIFKTGDDLRQDLLTIQLFRIMDRAWQREDKDMALKPYTCVATGVTQDGEGVGMIEVVDNSATISHIQIEEGGGALGAFKNKTLVKWLQKHNRNTTDYTSAADNFMRSCAGYCVATFCLGIGDRHNDNIMLTKDGHLFHIDFGHFLGNFKSKYGFKRERAPFVFTPEMAQVMGGLKSKEYKDFVTLCCCAFNILRKEASLFINLFNLMISAGMPELSCCEDIHYLRDRLLLNLNEDAASKAFKKEIKKTISDFYRRLDNSIHILKHG